MTTVTSLPDRLRRHADAPGNDQQALAATLREAADELEEAMTALSEPRLAGISIHENLLSIGMQGGACQLMASAFAEQFRQQGGVNYLEMSFESKDPAIGPLLLTLQRREGKTPHILRMEAEQRAAVPRQPAVTDDVLDHHASLIAASLLGQADQDDISEVRTGLCQFLASVYGAT